MILIILTFALMTPDIMPPAGWVFCCALFCDWD